MTNFGLYVYLCVLTHLERKKESNKRKEKRKDLFYFRISSQELGVEKKARVRVILRMQFHLA